MKTVVVEGGPIWLLILLLVIQWGIAIGFLVLWAASMSRALKACSASNRSMDAGSPWLILIPVFGLVWQFIAVKQTAESLAREYHHRGWMPGEGRPGIETGMITASVIIIVILMRILIIDLNPAMSFALTIVICVLIFMHRERLIAFTERLEKSNRETPMFFVYEQYNNPFAMNQRVQHYASSGATPHSHSPQAMHSPPGWDGSTIWSPPPGWQEPDMSDPGSWFNN